MAILNFRSACFVFFIIIFILHPCVNSAEDLYKVLGLKKGASMSEIKKAYRKEARETHPDKQKGKDPDVAAKEFRRIVEAYEILSDETSRRIYDETGGIPNQNKHQQSGFGFGTGGFHNRRHDSPGSRRQHRYLWDPYLRRQIQDAQSRILSVRSYSHLKSILQSEDDNDENGRSKPAVSERYCLLSFYDSSNTDCKDRLDYELLYPWPFAGYSGEGGDGIWWEEIMVAGSVDISTSAGRDLANRFGIPQKMSPQSCPYIGFIPRGSILTNNEQFIAQIFQNLDDFQSFVWDRLKMRVTFHNKTPFKLSQWWLDGYIGKRQDDVEPNEHILAPHMTWYTQQNPGHYDFTLRSCPVSCNFGCGARHAKDEF